MHRNVGCSVFVKKLSPPLYNNMVYLLIKNLNLEKLSVKKKVYIMFQDITRKKKEETDERVENMTNSP